jgi:hypothetical protein
MEPLKRYVSKLNLRVGYGKSGNLGGIDAFLSQQLITDCRLLYLAHNEYAL